MAINRLTDIVTAMKSKWTYGDKDFAYTFEVNEQHNTQYPYMMITPPNSQIPEVYNGWESYDFEIDFFDLYQTSSQQAVSLEQRWDNLQDLSLEWLDNLMIHYNNPTGANVGIYFLEESIDFQRVKEVANDRLVQIKMRFTLRAVTRCIFGSIPSTYPNQITGLASWLRADSNVVFSIPTKKVSSVGDNSGNANIVSQALAASQPLRYTYDGAADKTQFTFNNDVLVSDKNFPTDVSGEDVITNGNFTEIGTEEVSNGDFSEEGGEEIEDGSFPSGTAEWVVSDGTVAFDNGATFDNGSKIYQNNTLITGKTYKATYEITDNVGNMTLRFYNGGAYFYVNDSVGVHTVYFTALPSNTRFYINALTGTSLVLKNISLKEVGQDWTIGTGWSLGEDKVICDGTQVGTTPLIQSSVFTSGKFYKITFDLTISAGALSLWINGTQLVENSITSAGSKSYYIEATATGSIYFEGNVNFTGSITNISVKEVGQGWNVGGTDSVHYVEFPGEGARFVASTLSPVLVLQQQSILDIGSVYELTCTVAYTGTANNLRANIGGTNTAYFTEGENTRIGTASSHTGMQFLRNDVNVDALITNVSIKKIQSAADWSIFEVSKINAVSNAVFGYYHEGDDSYIEMGTNASGNYSVKVSDGTTLLSGKTTTVDTGKYHIGVLRKDREYLNFNYYDSLGSTVSVDSSIDFNTQTSFEKEKFRIGCTQTSNGLLPPTAINTRYLDGNFQEVIVYDRKLNDTETANVVNYLNNKYKIY
tara:strand:+ start:36 stop:2318 length:2283 start_codon:yes stop_codon:yes gene_type:complete